MSNARNRIRVFARFRPFDDEDTENKAGREESHLQYSTNAKSVGVKGQIFSFDKIWGPQASQDAIFEMAGQTVLQDVLRGFNGTILAYGQTGSGKTHTMQGSQQEPGLIPRCLESLFEALSARENADSTVTVAVSFYEIYLEQIYDLLEPQTKRENLRVRSHPTQGVYIENLTEKNVTSKSEAIEVFRAGYSNRSVAETKMNVDSSRGHSVFQITLVQDHTDGTQTRSKFNLVDLAGSERVSKSGVDGHELAETKAINLSLACLGKVIWALTDSSNAAASPVASPAPVPALSVIPTAASAPLFPIDQNMSPPSSPSDKHLAPSKPENRRQIYVTSINGPARSVATPLRDRTSSVGALTPARTPSHAHVPYRESKLTRVLAESLGGNARTCLILNCSSNPEHLAETVSTLRFGQRAKLVKNDVVINRISSPRVVAPSTNMSRSPSNPSAASQNSDKEKEQAEELQGLYTKFEELERQISTYQKQIQEDSFQKMADAALTEQFKKRIAELSCKLADMESERDDLKSQLEAQLQDKEREMELQQASSQQAEKETKSTEVIHKIVSQLSASQASAIEQQQRRYDESIVELEDILESMRLRVQAIQVQQTIAAEQELEDGTRSADISQVALLRYQNEELYQENSKLTLELEVLQKKCDQKDIHIADLEARLREYESAFGRLKPADICVSVAATDFA